MKQQSPMLTEFYRAYLAWVESGAPNEQPFDRSYGLCSNLDIFLRAVKKTPRNIIEAVAKQYEREQRKLFIIAKLDKAYPFNEGDYESYNFEFFNACTNENPLRLQWVQDHANFED